LLAPAGTPPAVIARYEAAALQVAQSAEFKSYLASQGYEALAADGAKFGKIVRDGLAKWERVAQERKIKVE
jgi:tripartite-type tricarboxylate transporter receptor subunit TctC